MYTLAQSVHLRLDFSLGGDKPVLWHVRLATVVPLARNCFDVSINRRWVEGGLIHYLDTVHEMEIDRRELPTRPEENRQSGALRARRFVKARR